METLCVNFPVIVYLAGVLEIETCDALLLYSSGIGFDFTSSM